MLPPIKACLLYTSSSLSLQPEKMKFIDRMVADSRQIALNHTAGLSPVSYTHLDVYKRQAQWNHF